MSFINFCINVLHFKLLTGETNKSLSEWTTQVQRISGKKQQIPVEVLFFVAPKLGRNKKGAFIEDFFYHFTIFFT